MNVGQDVLGDINVLQTGGPQNRTWLFLSAHTKAATAHFLSHLRELKAQNIDDYQVSIKWNGKTLKEMENYRAINIIGCISCANLENSEFENLEGMYMFDKLVINPTKIKSLNLFRVEKAHEYVVVSLELANQINLKKFSDIQLTPIECSE